MSACQIMWISRPFWLQLLKNSTPSPLRSTKNNCDYYEVFPASGANKYALVEDIEVDERGLVYAPTKPGLGYEIDWELVEREKVQVVK